MMTRAELEEALELIEAEGRTAQDAIAAWRDRLKTLTKTSHALRRVIEMTPAESESQPGPAGEPAHDMGSDVG